MGLSSVADDDNFYALGGDSLNALQMTTFLEQHDLTLNATEILRFPEFSQCVKRVLPSPRTQQMTNNEALSETRVLSETKDFPEKKTLPINNNTTDGHTDGQSYPLSPTQLRFLGRKLNNPHFFTIPVFVALKQSVSSKQLLIAIDSALAVADGHHVRFVNNMDGKGIEQFTHRWHPKDYFQSIDLTDTPAERHPDIIDNAAQDASQNLNIWEGPLFRILCFNHVVNHSHPVLFIVFHHLISDGLSVNLFLDRLRTELKSLTTESQAPAYVSSLQPGNYLSWVEAIHAYASTTDLNHARKQLENILSRSGIPKNKPSFIYPAHTEMSVLEQPILSSTEQSERLRDRAKQLKTSPFILLLAVFIRSLRQLNRSEVGVHIMGAQRTFVPGFDNNSSLSKCMGYFSAAIPFAGSLDQITKQADTAEELIPIISQRHNSCSLLALDYLILQYLLPALSNKETGGNHSPIEEHPEVLFHYLAADPRERDDEFFTPVNFSSGPASDAQNKSNYLLNVTLIHTRDGLRCRFYYSKQHFSSTDLVRLNNLLEKTISATCDECEAQTL